MFLEIRNAFFWHFISYNKTNHNSTTFYTHLSTFYTRIPRHTLKNCLNQMAFIDMPKDCFQVWRNPAQKKVFRPFQNILGTCEGRSSTSESITYILNLVLSVSPTLVHLKWYAQAHVVVNLLLVISSKNAFITITGLPLKKLKTHHRDYLYFFNKSRYSLVSSSSYHQRLNFT